MHNIHLLGRGKEREGIIGRVRAGDELLERKRESAVEGGEKGEDDDDDDEETEWYERQEGTRRGRGRRRYSSRAITQRSLRLSSRNNYDNTSVNTPLRYLHLWKREKTA